MSSSNAPYLTDWRNSFSLVRNNLQNPKCKNGTTFRGRNAHVEIPFALNNSCINSARADEGRSTGTAKPGPTVDNSSRIARIKKLQIRTRSNNVSGDGSWGTQRGAHSTVENSTWGVNSKSRRAQLFGSQGKIPGNTSGRGGDSSQLIYFKKVFNRVTFNQIEENSGNN